MFKKKDQDGELNIPGHLTITPSGSASVFADTCSYRTKAKKANKVYEKFKKFFCYFAKVRM
jgi:diacylglycerol kinase family enzyme